MVQAVIVFLLTLAVIAIAMFLALTSLDGTVGQEGQEVITTQITMTDGSNPVSFGGGVGNSTASVLALRDTATATLFNLNITNGTDSIPVNLTTDYTVNGGFIISASALYNQSLVNVTFTWKDLTKKDVDSITANTTSGVTDFFSNTSTIMTILGAVLIILAVTLILFAVNRFSQSSGAGKLSSGGGRGGSSSDESRL